MKTITCEASVLPNGQLLLLLPPETAAQLKPKPNTSNKRRIIILNTDEKTTPNRLSQFCGKWRDERDADEIIADIMADRNTNNRSNNMSV